MYCTVWKSMVQHYQGRLDFWKQINCFSARMCETTNSVVLVRNMQNGFASSAIPKTWNQFYTPHSNSAVHCTVWKSGATLPRPACFLKTDQLFFCENVWSNKWWCPRGMVLQVARGRARLLATSFSSSNARRQGRAAGRAGRQAARACYLIALRRSP